MGRLLRILLTHFLCTQGGCNKERKRGTERGEEGEEPLWINVCVCVCVQAPQGATCRRLKWNPWFQCNCAVKLPGKRFHLNVPPTSQLPHDCTIVGLCACCAIAISFQAELSLNSIMSSWTTVSVCCPRTIPLDHSPTVLIIISVSSSVCAALS